MFPQAKVAPVIRNVVHRRLLAIFCSMFKFCWVELSFGMVCHDIGDRPCVGGTTEN